MPVVTESKIGHLRHMMYSASLEKEFNSSAICGVVYGMISAVYFFQVSDVLWKNIHGKMTIPGGDVLTDMPVMTSSEPLFQKPEADKEVCNMDVLQIDEQSDTQGTMLQNSACLIWPDEEVI